MIMPPAWPGDSKPMTMQAGPELDRLVAEKAMGWSLYHYTKSRQGHWEWLTPPESAGVPIRIACGSVRGYFTEAEAMGDFQPSTNIAHAFEVVEHLRSGDCRWGFNLDSSSDKWTAIFYDPKMVGESTEAPHAICIAALKVSAHIAALKAVS